MATAVVIRHSITRLAPETELVKCLECPVCRCILMAPIYQCESGHAICSSCVLLLKFCGICRAKYSASRNYPLESIVNISLFKCAYETDGCREMVLGEDFQEHVKICDFRPILCTTCCNSQLISIRDYITHLVQNHDASTWKISKRSFKLQSDVYSFTDCAWPVQCVKLIFKNKQETFFKNEKIVNGIYNIWISFLGGQRKADKFRAELIIYNKENPNNKIEWHAKVYSFRRSEADMLSENSHISIPVKELMTLGNKTTGGTIQWMVQYTIVDFKCTNSESCSNPQIVYKV